MPARRKTLGLAQALDPTYQLRGMQKPRDTCPRALA